MRPPSKCRSASCPWRPQRNCRTLSVTIARNPFPIPHRYDACWRLFGCRVVSTVSPTFQEKCHAWGVPRKRLPLNGLTILEVSITGPGRICPSNKSHRVMGSRSRAVRSMNGNAHQYPSAEARLGKVRLSLSRALPFSQDSAETKPRLAGRSPRRRMKYGNHSRPKGM